MSAAPRKAGPLTVFVIAGEESGDILGAALMHALDARLGGAVRYMGVGGARMTAAGLTSLFPMEELALHGFTEVIRRLPRLLGLVRRTVAAVVAAAPDVLVLVDAPAFNLRVARGVRAGNPAIPVVDYVSPSVWAHHASRAPKMAPSVDEILAILPFEPEVHRRLGGPLCVYVGHPLLERLSVLRPAAGERQPLAERTPRTLLVLPGSRRSEIRRLMAPFGAAVGMIADRIPNLEVILPAVERLRPEIEAGVAQWSLKPKIVSGESAKLAAFRRAHAALAASGTVTLELALAAVPMAVGYMVDPLMRLYKPFVKVPSIVLANLVLGENAIPEFIDRDCRPDRLAAAVAPLLGNTPERAAQVAAFTRIDQLMAMPGDTPPADLAAVEVLATMRRRRQALAPA